MTVCMFFVQLQIKIPIEGWKRACGSINTQILSPLKRKGVSPSPFKSVNPSVKNMITGLIVGLSNTLYFPSINWHSLNIFATDKKVSVLTCLRLKSKVPLDKNNEDTLI